MKKQILTIVLGLIMITAGPTTFAATRPTVNQKIIKNFSGQFKLSVSPSIYSLNSGFIVKARVDEQNITSAYDVKGNWVYTIKSYAHNSMDANVIKTILDTYENYQIKGMEEIKQQGSIPVFLVHLQNRNSVKDVIVANDQTEPVKEFKKL